MNTRMTMNDEIFSYISGYLKKEDAARTAQPHLIVGESGSGKTFLLKRLAAGIEQESGGILYPALIDGRSLFSTDDIWRNCARRIRVDEGTAVFDNILSWQKTQMRRVVLLIDDIQYYFDRTDDEEQFKLRGNLNRPGAPVIIAASAKVPSSVTDYSAAFFDGFRISYIKPLSTSEIIEFATGNAGTQRLLALMSYLPKTPRSVFTASGILEVSGNPENDIPLLKQFSAMYCRTKYDGCVMQAQKILSVLANMKDGGTLRDIRTATGQNSGDVSPYLKSMVDRGLIIKESKPQRGGRYFIADPLLKLWLQEDAA